MHVEAENINLDITIKNQQDSQKSSKIDPE